MPNNLQVAKSHPGIKEVMQWKQGTDKELYYVIEDLSMLQMAREAQLPCMRFIEISSHPYREEAEQVRQYFHAHASEVFAVSDKTMTNLLDKKNQVGLIGVFRHEGLSLAEIHPETHPFLLVLDRLETPGNVGTILRSADATHVSLVLHVDSTVHLNHPKLIAASRGMVLFQPMAKASLDEALAMLVEKGYRLYLGEPEAGRPHFAYDYQGPIALVVGSERYGIQQKWFQIPHVNVFIPMEGKMNSLNVGVAASLLLYAAYEKRKLIK